MNSFADLRKNKELKALQEKKDKGLITEAQYEKEREKDRKECSEAKQKDYPFFCYV